MKILILEWNSYGNIEAAQLRRGRQVYKCTIDTHATGEQLKLQKDMVMDKISKVFLPFAKGDGYVFSYNYFPWVSEICNELGVIYVSWVYDSPFMDLYSYTVPNPVNRIFVFDYGVYSEFEVAGINTVFYLPLGVDSEVQDSNDRDYISDISFVGSLYTEPKHRLYDKFNTLPPYTKGYLDAVIASQKNIYGENIIEQLLTDEMIKQMEECYPTDPNPTSAMTPKQIYSQFVLYRQVTSLERTEVLASLGDLDSSIIRRNLYTHDKDLQIAGWKNYGPVDYYDEMPKIFAKSKINLNITLRSIRTGIPLRALDIMAAGGFLMSNYQQELCEYFIPDVDFVFYEDIQDLKNKVVYYLTHDEEREAIARNSQRKVLEEHNLDARLDHIEATILN